MEILKIFTECIIWEVKKWFLECVRDVWLLKYVLGGAHLPIPYRTQFNFLNIMPSAPVLPPYSSFCSHFLPLATLYYVFPPRMFQAISAWIAAALYTPLPYHAACSPFPSPFFPSHLPIVSSLLLPPPIPLPLSGPSHTLLRERLLLTLPVWRVLVFFSTQAKFHFLRKSVPAPLLHQKELVSLYHSLL